MASKIAKETVMDVLIKEGKQSKERAETLLGAMLAHEEQLRKTKKSTEAKERQDPGEFVIIISDPLMKIPTREEFTGWVVRLGASDGVEQSIGDTLSIIEQTSREYNELGVKKLTVLNVADALENLPNNILQARGVRVLTREPAYVCVTNNAPYDSGLSDRGIADALLHMTDITSNVEFTTSQQQQSK
ncbi:MAG: hypothetical protein RR382_00030 [Tannerellaceae bacterium]